MGSRRKNLIKININEYDNDKEKTIISKKINYYTILMKPDAPEYDHICIKTILEVLIEYDLIKNPDALNEVDLMEVSEKYNLSYFEWEKLLGKDYDNHFEIKTIVEKELLNCGTDYPGLIIEVDYNYYHNYKTRQIKLNNLIVYGFLNDKGDFYIIPYNLYRAYEEFDQFESFADGDFLYHYYLSNKEKFNKDEKLDYLDINHFNITLSNGQNIEINDEFKDFLQSTYANQSPNDRLPLICNICHNPIKVKENEFPYIFNISSLNKLGEKYDKNINIPFTEEEINMCRKDDMKYLNIFYRDKIVAYHNKCLCK